MSVPRENIVIGAYVYKFGTIRKVIYIYPDDKVSYLGYDSDTGKHVWYSDGLCEIKAIAYWAERMADDEEIALIRDHGNESYDPEGEARANKILNDILGI